jgi:hypothetical protein
VSGFASEPDEAAFVAQIALGRSTCMGRSMSRLFVTGHFRRALGSIVSPWRYDAATRRPFTNPDLAVLKIVEVANDVEAVDGWPA